MNKNVCFRWKKAFQLTLNLEEKYISISQVVLKRPVLEIFLDNQYSMWGPKAWQCLGLWCPDLLPSVLTVVPHQLNRSRLCNMYVHIFRYIHICIHIYIKMHVLYIIYAPIYSYMLLSKTKYRNLYKHNYIYIYIYKYMYLCIYTPTYTSIYAFQYNQI